jgi:hypothetical protein
MKISILKPNSVNVNPWLPELRKRNIQVLENRVDKDCDFIICASHSQINTLEYWHKIYPEIPIINYNWDLYEWVWTNPRGYNWKKYGEYLKISKEIWVPSEEVSMRSEEYFGVGDLCHTIHTFARFFEADKSQVLDKRYIYNPLRAIPDRNHGWLEKVCKTNNIPLFSSNHRLSEQEFQKSILECSFMVCEYYEASTGGLTLLEGHYHGKPCIISDSPYMGAKEYLGNNAIYFKHNDYKDFERVVVDTWNNTPVLNPDETKKIFNHLTIENMVDKMIERMEFLK